MQDIKGGIRRDIGFAYRSSKLEALPIATFICWVKRLFDVFRAFIMPDMAEIIFRKTKNDSTRIVWFPWLFYLHTIHQFNKERSNKEENFILMTTKKGYWNITHSLDNYMYFERDENRYWL